MTERKLDIFPHIFPRAYFERMQKIAEGNPGLAAALKRWMHIPVLWDLDKRIKMMKRCIALSREGVAAGTRFAFGGTHFLRASADPAPMYLVAKRRSFGFARSLPRCPVNPVRRTGDGIFP